MQSSFSLFCRALVMLACLVVLPLAAITGDTGRKVIIPLAERCLDLLRERPIEPGRRSSGPAPPARLYSPPPRHGQAEADTSDASRVATRTGVAASVPGQTVAADHQRSIEQRLRDLGATYYTLEKWGNSDRLYRFECRMAIANDANYTRFFEATSDRPADAMDRVLKQVEAWRVDRTLR